jgi:hypothetical protein
VNRSVMFHWMHLLALFLHLCSYGFFKNLTTYEILKCLYVDDGALPFGMREYL